MFNGVVVENHMFTLVHVPAWTWCLMVWWSRTTCLHWYTYLLEPDVWWCGGPEPSVYTGTHTCLNLMFDGVVVETRLHWYTYLLEPDVWWCGGREPSIYTGTHTCLNLMSDGVVVQNHPFTVVLVITLWTLVPENSKRITAPLNIRNKMCL